MEPDAVEIRVLGCLLEKQRTTPDVYPLSLNALRLACNQATSRDPVVTYDETTIRDALQRLGHRRWTRLASASRATKYRHLLDEALGLDRAQLAILTVLMLRGPQTPSELRTRTQRLHPFPDDDALAETIRQLVERGHAELLPRRTGQKEQRYRQLLGGEVGRDAARPGPSESADGAAGPGFAPASALDPAPAPAAAADPVPTAAPAPAPADETAARLARLEDEVAALRDELHALRRELGA